MAAYFETGFSVRKPMWHGEGLVLADYPTDWQDARAKAGLLWEPQAVPVYGIRPNVAVCGICGAALNQLHEAWCAVPSLDQEALRVAPEHVNAEVTLDQALFELPDHKQIVRSDTGAVLGVVGKGFELVSHEAMGGILESVLDAGQGSLKFETAGSIRLGAQVWVLVYLDEPYRVAGDNSVTLPFLAILNSHDGSGSCKIVRTQVRVVCWNTYNAASMEGERLGLQFTFRHTAGIHSRIEDAKAAINGLRDDVKEWDAMATDLYSLRVDDVGLGHFIADFIPEPTEDVISPRVRNNIDVARKMFKSMYLESVTTEAHRGTALGLVDAGTEYLDHGRAYRSKDTYMGRTMLTHDRMKAKLVTLARAAANN